MKAFILNRSLPKWIILLIDQAIMSWSFALSYFITVQFNYNEIWQNSFIIYVSIYMLVPFLVFYYMNLHTGLIRYSSFEDITRIFIALLSTCFVFGLLDMLVFKQIYHLDSVNIYAFLLIHFSISFTLLVMLRLIIKSLYFYIKNQSSESKENVLIYGANENSILVKEALETSGHGRFIILGFIDNNLTIVNKCIQQKRVYHANEVVRLHRKLKIDKIVISNEDIASDARLDIIDKCLELGIKILKLPNTSNWISGKLKLDQLQGLKIEDLLHRQPIVLNNEKVCDDVFGKRVLVTGGAGSIGSEIVRQVLNYKPAILIICDQAESPLHELQLEIKESYPSTVIEIYVGDIQNFDRMYSLFKKFNPQIIYHAAAYKHVPMMESNPSEAIMTNVLGTKHLADLSVSFDVEKFVMLSTDKAVNPTNIMGASKRIAEIYVQSLNYAEVDKIYDGALSHKTKFITTRFGNVLGSNGSVIPRFRSQIENGGPVTITHPEITRYFMTIPEAVQLVLEAGTMGNGGEIFVFDMGQPVKILDLAHKMIKLAGFSPGGEIKIIFTGLRPGEKLYEELLNREELTIPTYHDKIKVSKVRKYAYSEVLVNINDLLLLTRRGDDVETVRKMKMMVPEFISKNSKYEELDLVIS
jgi:FlaA1/EpsC-like NDP-sugar epimerase